MTIETKDLAKAEIEFLSDKCEKLEKENAQLHKFLEEFNALEVAKENQQLKELLKECKQMFVAEKSFLVQCSRLEDIENIITKIDEVLE